MEPNNTYIDWLCEKCKSNRVELFGATLRWLKVSEDEDAWTIVEPSETEYQCIECDNQGWMKNLIQDSWKGD